MERRRALLRSRSRGRLTAAQTQGCPAAAPSLSPLCQSSPLGRRYLLTPPVEGRGVTSRDCTNREKMGASKFLALRKWRVYTLNRKWHRNGAVKSPSGYAPRWG